MEENKYTFGDSNHNSKTIKADTLDEAVNEFILSCIDFSEFSYKYNPLRDKKLDEPIGFTNGKRNEEFGKHRFYELIPVYLDGKRVKEITLTDFRNWHLRQENILENKVEYTSENKQLSTESMVQMNRHIISTSMKIRKVKLDMALERKHNLLSTNEKMKAMQSQIEKVEKEYQHLQKKMGILKTYTGIGRDIVKIRGGKKSDKEIIDIFQSFRYMKEDIEILTDFRGFDARNLEQFDEFMKEHYKELLPSEKCIQAFKVTEQQIKYEDMLEQSYMNKENKKVYIMIRNGENVYRIFNQYDLHSNYLFMLDNATESINNLVRDMINTRRFSKKEDFEAIKDSYDAKISAKEHKGEWHSGWIGEGSYYACAIPFEYDEKLLANMQKEADDKYNLEIQKRKNYIERYALQDDLDIYSWRWGLSLGEYKRECNKEILFLKNKMDVLEAYKKNDYFTIYALINGGLTYYSHYRITDEKRELKPYDNGIAYTDYSSYRSSDNKNDFDDDFDPITAEPLIREALWYDYEKYKASSIDKARDEIQDKLNEQNFKNFNSVAILQNILDSGIIFDNLPIIDLIVGRGIEVLNFVKDSMNLLSCNSDYKSPFIDAKSLKKGDKIYVIRNSGYQIVENRYFREKEMRTFGKAQVLLADVKKVTDTEIKVHGYFDVYKNYNYERDINIGSAKLSTEIVEENWSIVKADIKEEDILRLLKNRHFRETQFNSGAYALREVLDLKRSGNAYNFAGGIDYIRN